VEAVSRELSGEALTRFNNDVNRRIFELTGSADSSEKLGGIEALGKRKENSKPQIRLAYI
jgi:FKBP12-rapamycin complex-associated protein